MMELRHVCIEGMGYAVPEHAYTSAQIETRLEPLYTRLKLPLGRLELMTGIRERRFWEEPITPSAAAIRAALPLLQGEKIGCVIHASVCRDRLEPATAAYVHAGLKLPAETLFFDLSSACLGFLNAMQVAAAFIEGGHMERVLIVAGENGRPLLEHTIEQLLKPEQTRASIKPYFANLTIGAGAVAMLLCHEKVHAADKPLIRLKNIMHRVDTSAVNLCEGGHATGAAYEMMTDAEALLKAGLALAKTAWVEFCDTCDVNADYFKRIITHQVGRQHQLQLYAALGLDIRCDFSTYETWGNVGSVSVPLSLARYLEVQGGLEGPLALLGIGSGLTTSMMAITPDR